ncbi:MAG: hypothetical protein IJS39_06125 [Synergistaceae bacterium]|nr:hypothetical protein [Synergistaceae bacterium]
MKNESKNWTEQAEPILSHLLNGYTLVPVESGNDCVSEILAYTCGINYLMLRNGTTNVYGVHNHTQCGKNHRVFTIPKSNYEKRTEAFASGAMQPYYTMQVYMDEGRIIGLGLIKTADFMQFIVNGHAEEKESFYVCSWDDLRKAGFNVMEYRSEPEEEPDDEDEEDDEDLDEIAEICEKIAEILDKARLVKRPY